MAPQRENLPSLTSLRFIAAAAVVVFHAQGAFGMPGFLKAFSLTQAVSLFYVLSGFILAHSHQSGGTLLEFYASRFARIWPAHVVCALVAAGIITYQGGEISLSSAALNLLLLQSWVPDSSVYFSLNGVSWSLSNEVFFYALFPLLVVRPWRFLIASLVLTVASLIVFGLLSRPLMLWGSYISPLVRLMEFALGVAAYRVFISVRGRFSSMSLPGATLLEAAAFVLAGVLMVVGHVQFRTGLPIHLPKSFAVWFANTGAGVGFAALIAVFALHKGLISKALSVRPFRYLGEISFAVYLTHQLVYRTGWWGTDNSAATGVWAYWLAVLVCSALLYHLVEVPAKSVIIGLVRGRGTATPSAQPQTVAAS